MLFFVNNLMSQITIKPTLGLNFNDFSKDQSTGDYKAKPGGLIGASVAIGKKVYLEPGLFYAVKSTEFVSTGSSGIPDVNTQLKGFRVPVALGFNLVGNEKSTVSIRGFGGGSAFFITNVVSDVFNPDNISKANWGVFAGAGLDFWKFFLDMQYEWSLTDIQKNVTTVDVGQTRTIFINAGLRINM